jgi:hypothetical protein
MKSWTTHHTTTQINKFIRIVVKKRLTDYKAAPAKGEEKKSHS